MSEVTRVVVDAMGGDYAPEWIIRGAVEAINEGAKAQVILTGKEDVIKKELAKYTYDQSKIEVVNATEEITCHEAPVQAVRSKKDSSLVVGLNMVKNGEADAIISAGSSGAILAGGQLVVGRSKGVKRSPLAPLLPTSKGYSLLIDCGANVDARPEHLVQFAQMGSVYFENVMGKKNPTVGIVNIGTEEEKGNQLVKETYPLLRDCKNINFVGSVEARDIAKGGTDILVCEAFVGNVILKFFEGVAKTFLGCIKEGIMKSLRTKIGGMLIKPALKGLLKTFDVSSQGGAPLLGLKGLVVKAHGNSKSAEIKTALGQCITFKENSINEKIQDKIQA